MESNTFSSTKTMKSGWMLFLCMAAMAFVIFANPNGAQSTDRLIVQDSTGTYTEFAAEDNGAIRLNSNTLPASVPSWALIYGSSNSSNTGYALDSYGSPATGSTIVTLGGGGAFRFARGTQSSPAAVVAGDRLGYFVFSGYDGVNGFVNAAGFTSKVDGTVSAGFVPAKLAFETIAQSGENASDGARVERMIITSKGYVAIGGDTGSGITEPTTLLHLANGAYSDGATWYSASSREYKENINFLSTREADEVLKGLNPVKYNYKIDKENKHVGFIAEDVPELVAAKDRKGLSALDIVAVLTKVVQEQKNTISEQTNMISELSKRLDAMQQDINRVKAMNIVGSIGASIK